MAGLVLLYFGFLLITGLVLGRVSPPHCWLCQSSLHSAQEVVLPVITTSVVIIQFNVQR